MIKLRWLVILLLVFSTVGCGEVKLKGPEGPKAPIGSNEGEQAPDFELTTLDGRRESLSQYRGQPVMINFFTTWCIPCMIEMPAIQASYVRYRPQGLAILAVDVDEAANVVAQMRDSKGLTFPMLMDTGRQVAQMYQTSYIPRTFYVDAQGIIRKVVNSEQTESQIAEAVEDLFEYGGRIPTPTAQAAQKPPKQEAERGMTGCVNINAALVRSGPGSSQPVITQMGYQTCAPFDARSADGAWLRLSRKEGSTRLWVTAEYISLQGDVNSLPVGE